MIPKKQNIIKNVYKNYTGYLSTKMKDKLRELGYNVMGREVSWYKPETSFAIETTYIEKTEGIYKPIYENRVWGNPYF